MSDIEYLVFDTETTGVDTDNDRVVQLFIGLYDANGGLVSSYEWIINPGIDMPEAASDIHGFTTGYLQKHGRDPWEALEEASNVFYNFRDKVWVAFNLNFDLSILDSEFLRHRLHSAWGEYAKENVRLYDPIVIDRYRDKYRKGKRTLAALANHYGLEFDADEAHNAIYDVTKTAEVTVQVVKKYGQATNAQQAAWYKQWATHLQEYFRKTDPEAYVNPGWPLRDPEPADSVRNEG